jgi:hypothetical protein
MEPKALAVYVLVALDEMRFGNRPLHIWITARKGLEVRP